jgi:hypothetical protein
VRIRRPEYARYGWLSVLVPTALLALWQWVLGGSITGRPAQRLRLTGAGMVITLVYSVPMTLWLLMTAGFVY